MSKQPTLEYGTAAYDAMCAQQWADEQQAGLPPESLDQLADELDAFVNELAGRVRYLRTLALRHRVAGRRARSESAIGVAEKMIADGYVGGRELTSPAAGGPYTPVDYLTVYANAASGDVCHYRADGTLSHTTPRKTEEE